MGTKMIPLSQRESDPRGTLNECCDSGEALVVEMPDKRMVTIQPLDSIPMRTIHSLASSLNRTPPFGHLSKGRNRVRENHSLAGPKARMLPRDAASRQHDH